MVRDLWDIDREFDKMRRYMGDWYDDFLTDKYERRFGFPGRRNFRGASCMLPKSDIYETENEVIAKIEMPYVKKENIKLLVKNNTLSLKAQQIEEKEDKDEKKTYYRMERRFTGFMRNYTLPSEVDETKVTANYKDGLLEVHMPKKKHDSKDSNRYIDIK